MTETVFVYGTLTDDEQVSRLYETYQFIGRAICQGLSRVSGTYPTLVPGGRVDGRLLTVPDLGRLDAYEGVDRGLYSRFTVPVVESETVTAERQRDTEPRTGPTDQSPDEIVSEAAVYIGEPRRLDAVGADKNPWPGSGPFDDRVGTYLQTKSVVVKR